MNLASALSQLPLLIPRPPTPRDRRATARVRLCLCVDEHASGESLRRHSYDLSTFGLSLAKGPRRDQGTLLRLTLYLPDGRPQPLKLNAEVLGTHRSTGGVRVAFRQLEDDALKRLHRLVSDLSAAVRRHKRAV